MILCTTNEDIFSDSASAIKQNNESLDHEGVSTSTFYDLVNECSRRLNCAAANTSIPVKSDQKRIDD
jgi:hypothetical protein